MNPQKNYIDERGNYHNVENLTLTQIHDRASEEGYRLGITEGLKTAIESSELLPKVVEIIRDILPQVVEIAEENIKGKATKLQVGCKGCKYEELSALEYPCNECKRACLDKYEKDGQADE